MAFTSAMALAFCSWISRWAEALNSSASLRLLAISSSRNFSTSCWLRRSISCDSRRASAMAVFCSASSFSASARSRLAASMELAICFSRSSTSREDGAPRLHAQDEGDDDEGDEGPEDEARTDLHEAVGGEDGGQVHGGLQGEGI